MTIIVAKLIHDNCSEVPVLASISLKYCQLVVFCEVRLAVFVLPVDPREEDNQTLGF